MADANRPSSPPEWRDAFSALPLDAPPSSRWPQISAALAARPTAAARDARRRRVRIGAIASFAAAAALAALVLWPRLHAPSQADAPAATPGIAHAPAPPTAPDIPAPVRTTPKPPTPHATPTSTVATTETPRRRDIVAARHTRASTPRLEPARMSGGERGRRSEHDTTDATLDTLYLQSARLEAVLRSTRDSSVDSGPAAAVAGALDSDLARIDALLAQPDLDDAGRTALWRARVDTLRRSASFETSLRSLSAQGTLYQGTLASVD